MYRKVNVWPWFMKVGVGRKYGFSGQITKILITYLLLTYQFSTYTIIEPYALKLVRTRLKLLDKYNTLCIVIMVPGGRTGTIQR